MRPARHGRRDGRLIGAHFASPANHGAARWHDQDRLSSIRSLRRAHCDEIDALPAQAAADRLCELNVLAQTSHLAHTSILGDAWDRGQDIRIHSWIYRLEDGIIHPLREPIAGPA
jgi:carbonic anhydrase